MGILLFDFVPVDFLWGGRMETREQLLVFEIVSFVIMALCFFVVLIKSEMVKIPGLMSLATIALWILVILFILNTIGNMFAKTGFEKFLAIFTAILSILCLRLALEKNRPLNIK